MRIALIGYGTMGQEIDHLATDTPHRVVARISPQLTPDAALGAFNTISAEALEMADVCIDFSHPSTVVQNIEQVLRLRRPLVVGTTGWYDALPQVRGWVEEADVGFVYAANFSLGITLFLELLSHAGSLFGHHKEYDVSGVEYHHKHKADCPSGTAQTIVKTLIKAMPNKMEAIYDRPRQPLLPHQIHFSSVRCGAIPGTHEIVFDSEGDTITLSHTARSRRGFASGALLAAEWVIGKKGCHHFSDIARELQDPHHLPRG